MMKTQKNLTLKKIRTESTQRKNMIAKLKNLKKKKRMIQEKITKIQMKLITTNFQIKL